MSWSEFVKLDRGRGRRRGPERDGGRRRHGPALWSPGATRPRPRASSSTSTCQRLADDIPLGAGLRTPEWDWRKRVMLPDHCAVQCLMARPPQARISHGPTCAPPRASGAGSRCCARRRAGRARRNGRRDRPRRLGARRSRPAAARRPARRRRSRARRERGERSLATLLLADLSLVDRRLRDLGRA